MHHVCFFNSAVNYVLDFAFSVHVPQTERSSQIIFNECILSSFISCESLTFGYTKTFISGQFKSNIKLLWLKISKATWNNISYRYCLKPWFGPRTICVMTADPLKKHLMSIFRWRPRKLLITLKRNLNQTPKQRKSKACGLKGLCCLSGAES